MNLAQISSNIIFITTITIITGKKPNSNISSNIHLLHYVIPVHYHIKLTHLYTTKYDFNWAKLYLKNEYAEFIFHGESSTTINILQSTQNIRLHSLYLDINQQKITLIKNNATVYALKKYTEFSKTNLLEFRFSNILSPGIYTLKMEFVGQLTESSEKNFFESFYMNKENGIAWFITSHIQAKGARQLFPCWDEPHLKTTFTIFIKHHHDFTALSNMPPRIHLSSDIDDFIWTKFCTTPPLSTFQIALVITNYPRMRINENIYLWCEKCSEYNNQSLKFEFARKIIENITFHLKSEFNRINIPKIDHVAIPNFPRDGTSKWGLIFHRETDLIYDEQLDPVMRKIKVARLIAPKIAYQWFSNIFIPSHFWLHNGLATLFGEEAINKTFVNSEIMAFFIVQNQYESLHLDSYFNMNPAQINNLSEINSIFNFPSYIKVLIVLRMCQTNITDEEFRKNVHTYLYKHTFNSWVLYEIWSIIREKLSNTNPYYMSDEFLNWIKYRHYPIVSWTRETPYYGILAQHFNATSYGKWWIFTRLTRQFSSPRSLKISLTSQESVKIWPHRDEQGWILVDIQQAGYYRVNYDSKNWHIIAHCLNSGRYKSISVINRAKIIDDAFHLMMARQLNVSIFWELTKYLSQETDFVAWYPMIKVFEYMSTIFPFSSTRYKLPFSSIRYKFQYIDIKAKFRKLLDKPLKILGFEENIKDNDFTKCLRQEIVKWACTLDHPECAIATHHKLHRYLDNPKKYPVLSEWEQWTYCKSLSVANYSTWDKLTVILSKKPDHKLLLFLVCCLGEISNMPVALQHLFNLFTPDEKQDIAIIRSQINTFYSVLKYIIMKYINTYYILDELLLNLPEIKPKEIKMLTALTVIINNIYYDGLLEYNILRELKRLKYINIKQLSMIEHKITKRNLEIMNHIEHFKVINVRNVQP